MILGLDWGKKKIGLAIVHEDMPIASAIGAIANDKMVLQALAKIIDEYGVELIVIGRSSHVSQNDNVIDIDAFGEKCESQLHIPIEYATEIFSTREAQNNLKMTEKKGLSAFDDSEAARIILQSYMDARKRKV